MSTGSERNSPVDNAINDLIENFNRVLVPNNPEDIENLQDLDQEQPEMPEAEPEVVPQVAVNNDYRADEVRRRPCVKGHHTRALQRLQAWSKRIDRTLCRTPDFTELKSTDFAADNR